MRTTTSRYAWKRSHRKAKNLYYKKTEHFTFEYIFRYQSTKCTALVSELLQNYVLTMIRYFS